MREYRQNPKNLNKIAAYEKLRNERRRLKRLGHKLEDGDVIEVVIPRKKSAIPQVEEVEDRWQDEDELGGHQEAEGGILEKSPRERTSQRMETNCR